jgi:tetratricopeptide (TPR) repeat protein
MNSVWLVLAWACSLCAPAPAVDGDYKKGDLLVVVAKPTIARGEDGGNSTFAYGDGLEVVGVEDDRLAVRGLGRTGSVRRNEVLSLATAPKYFTTLIQRQETAIDLVARGRAHEYLEQQSAAFDDAERAIELDPNCGQAYVLRSSLWIARLSPEGNKDRRDAKRNAEVYNAAAAKAEADAEKGAALLPNDQEAAFSVVIARTCARRGTVIEDYTKYLKRFPSDTRAMNNRAKAYIDDNRIDDALEELNKALSLDPNYSDAYTNRGICFHRRREMDRAIEDATSALRCNPKNPSAWNNRGNAYIELKQFDKAAADFKKLIELKPEGIEGYYGRANTYYLGGKPRQALVDIDQVIELCPYDYKAHNTKGNIQKQQGDYAAAVITFNNAVDLVEQEAQTWNLMPEAVASVLAGSDTHEQSIRQFYNRTTLATILGNRADAYRNLIEKDPKARRKMFDDLSLAILFHPENPLYVLARAQQHYHAKSYVEAYRDFAQTLKQTPASIDALRGHLLTALELDKREEAKLDAEKLAKLGQPIDDETMKRIDGAAEKQRR